MATSEPCERELELGNVPRWHARADPAFYRSAHGDFERAAMIFALTLEKM
jgi:hypothetical protein